MVLEPCAWPAAVCGPLSPVVEAGSLVEPLAADTFVAGVELPAAPVVAGTIGGAVVGAVAGVVAGVAGATVEVPLFGAAGVTGSAVVGAAIICTPAPPIAGVSAPMPDVVESAAAPAELSPAAESAGLAASPKVGPAAPGSSTCVAEIASLGGFKLGSPVRAAVATFGPVLNSARGSFTRLGW